MQTLNDRIAVGLEPGMRDELVEIKRQIARKQRVHAELLRWVNANERSVQALLDRRAEILAQLDSVQVQDELRLATDCDLSQARLDQRAWQDDVNQLPNPAYDWDRQEDPGRPNNRQ